MRDGPVRRVVKRVGLGVYVVRLWLHRAQAEARGDIRYELGGSCQGCGQCCEAPGIQVGKLAWHMPLFRRIFLFWHRHVNGFVLEEVSRHDRGFIFECTHFDPEEKLCDSYESRPGMCRDYPRVQLEQAHPELLPKCGFRILDRRRDELVQILDGQNLRPEQMEKLKKELHLE